MRSESFLHEPLIFGFHVLDGVQVNPLGQREDQVEEVVAEHHQEDAHLVDGQIVEEPDRPDELNQVVVLVAALLRELHVDRQVDADEQRGDRDLLREYLLYDAHVSKGSAYMLINNEEDHDKEHYELASPANSPQVADVHGDAAALLLELLARSEGAMLIIDVSENDIREQVPDILNGLLVLE